MIAEKEAIVIGEKQPHGQNSMHGVVGITLENIWQVVFSDFFGRKDVRGTKKDEAPIYQELFCFDLL